MKRNIIVLAVLLWLIATGTAFALDKCLKDPAFCRTGVITTVTCDMACGNCNSCNTCDKCNKCSTGCGKHATATYIGDNGQDGFWLTSAHAVNEAKKLWVNGELAEIAAQGCANSLKCGKSEMYGCGWVVLKTVHYVPCGACPATPSFGDICCDQGLFYVDIRKCRTVTKVVVHQVSEYKNFRTNTLPDCDNCGAGVYDLCGRLVGIMVGGGKEGCGCSKDRYTEFIGLRPVMFTVLTGETTTPPTSLSAT